MRLQELYLNSDTRSAFFKWIVAHADTERKQITVDFRKKDGTMRSLTSTPVLRHAYKEKGLPRIAKADNFVTLVDDEVFDAYRLGGLDFDDAIGRAFRTVNADRVTRLTYNNEFAWNFM